MVSKVREKIVSAALECFHELGFSACSVQDIVDRAGVPKGSFYNYFKAKELLAVEALDIYTAGSRRELLSDISVAPVGRLRSHFEFLASRYAGFGYAKGCLIGNLAAECSDNMPLVRQALAESLTRWANTVAATIRAGQSDGSIVPGLDVDTTARFMINSWEGAVVRMKIAVNREPLDDFFAVIFPLLTRPTVEIEKAGTNRPVASRVQRQTTRGASQ
ncbi:MULTISPECIES: TetR/AcrR family transcriptional regulator [Paraburkholderia]|uniref:TetR/AcrR family transcriptional regulator n=1 Tax=Paraburkholderia TaxID=1822464 RepID=UPI0022564800|nr:MULTISPECIES: TetR/AcrR family transcriptional regulator [Paraburkholderia]MCX4174525.1 TetR family transcriptional regulator C-terminal domain-containing protein [Paraburkholderia madseniana]MDQ6462526.1 TetR/AcrR family transcriptional regulator [Paraburkholderia madseniana]